MLVISGGFYLADGILDYLSLAVDSRTLLKTRLVKIVAMMIALRLRVSSRICDYVDTFVRARKRLMLIKANIGRLSGHFNEMFDDWKCCELRKSRLSTKRHPLPLYLSRRVYN